MPETTHNVDSKFRFILLAAKRARQLQAGAKPLIHTSSRKHTRVALEEMKAGALKWEYLTDSRTERVAEQEASASPRDRA